MLRPGCKTKCFAPDGRQVFGFSVSNWSSLSAGFVIFAGKLRPLAACWEFFNFDLYCTVHSGFESVQTTGLAFCT